MIQKIGEILGTAIAVVIWGIYRLFGGKGLDG